jgi:drug/metabolite transporter (DMT)-like permease
MKTGVLLLLTAEFLFALSTVFVKFVTNGTAISGVEIAFFRFFTGFIITFSYIKASGKYFPMVKPFNIYMRGLFNTTSVIFFFLGVQYTTISNTNLLNMTYPAFVFLISPFITKEKIPRDLLIFLFTVLAGIYLVVIPDSSTFGAVNKGDIYALLSGITAGFGISFLRESRKTDYTQTILLYMFAIGSTISGLFLINKLISIRIM